MSCRPRRRATAAIACWSLAAGLAGAVSAGIAAAATIRVPGDQPTIAAALAVAGPGDQVLLSPGTYAERVSLPSGVILAAEGGPGSAILDGGGGGTVITCLSPEAGTTLSGLVLRGGTGTAEGDTRLGGALLVRGGHLRLTDLRIEGSSADLGGGLFADGADIDWVGGSLAGNTGTFGGGWFASGGALRLEGVEISGNRARAGGGGHGSSLAPFQVVSCNCHDNSADADGGVFHLGASGAALNDSRFVANAAGGNGGALYLDSGTMASLSYVVLLDNRAALAGGGLFVTCSGPIGVTCTEARLFHADLVANHAPGSGAGAVAGTATIAAEASLIAGNEGGIVCLSGPSTIDIACTALFANGVDSPSSGCTPAFTDTLVEGPRLCDLVAHDASRCANSPLLAPPPCGLPFLGALGQGCPACSETPTEPATWGSLKARYR